MLRFILWYPAGTLVGNANANATKQSAKNADAVSQAGRVRGVEGASKKEGDGKSKAKTANETQRNVSILIVTVADLKGLGRSQNMAEKRELKQEQQQRLTDRE